MKLLLSIVPLLLFCKSPVFADDFALPELAGNPDFNEKILNFKNQLDSFSEPHRWQPDMQMSFACGLDYIVQTPDEKLAFQFNHTHEVGVLFTFSPTPTMVSYTPIKDLLQSDNSPSMVNYYSWISVE